MGERDIEKLIYDRIAALESEAKEAARQATMPYRAAISELRGLLSDITSASALPQSTASLLGEAPGRRLP